MKKRLALATILLTLASSHSVFADSGVINVSSLNLRQKPSLSSSILSFIPINTKISTLEKSGNFYKVTYKGKTGYVYSSYVKIVQATTVAPIKLASTTQTGVGSTKVWYLNVRKTAATGNNIIGIINPTNNISLYGTENGYYKIKYNNTWGYIAKSYVSTSATSAVVTIPVASSTLSSTTQTGVGSTKVGYLNVRKTAATGNNIIGIINPTNNISLYGTENGYYKIKYNNTWGYIAKSYVSTSATSAVVTIPVVSSTLASTTKTGVGSTKVWCLNVRKTAATGNNIIGIINPTNNINLYGTLNGYYKIKYNNTWGYIVKSCVITSKVTTPVPSTASQKKSLIANAEKLIGIPYIWGGATTSGFDCSGLVQYIYKSIGVTLPRTTYQQVGEGSSVSINNLEVGDLVFFIGNAHVGIYVGNNKFIEAQKSGTLVKIADLSGYWRTSFVTGRRIL
ncbi:SH3 domain-containing protein [Clostridium estertheticum]|uniref:C40 family peptidase n=3 Tax=Clostridium estertheticum TaxID=238834 RepID=UPI00227ABD6D|nr:SH3 domain-containing protein [Clostridium estertheticum]WAG67918.1 SH3 domain-containing protein [Clostridium estertheticum]